MSSSLLQGKLALPFLCYKHIPSYSSFCLAERVQHYYVEGDRICDEYVHECRPIGCLSAVEPLIMDYI